MRVQTLALAVTLASALGGNTTWALGLGDIKLNSKLNQPLDAEIELLQTRGLGESEIIVQLANLQDFERAGVDRSYLLNDLKFALDNSGEHPVVRISSSRVIREPFLNFVLETRWPSGKLLREYTLLMDLPAPAVAAQPVRAAVRERQQVQRSEPVSPEPEIAGETAVDAAAAQQPPVSGPQRSQPAAPGAAPPDGTGRLYGPVATDQTLWRIALEAREDAQLSVQQTMLAIQRLNPQAFIDGNINLLKAGSVLRLPTAQQVRTLNPTEAVSQVASQNASWRGTEEGETLGAPLDARSVAATEVAAETVAGRLSLAAPGDNDAVLSGSGSGAEASVALAGELAQTREELDKSRLDQAELQSRLAELNEQIETMERLVAVYNDELAALQTAATADDEPADTEQQPAASATVPLESAEEPAQVAAAEPVPADEIVAPKTPANTVSGVAATPPPAPAREATLLERLMEHSQMLATAAGLLLISLLGVTGWRRRRAQRQELSGAETPAAQVAVGAQDLLAEPQQPAAGVDGGAESGQTDDLEMAPLGAADTRLPLGQDTGEDAESEQSAPEEVFAAAQPEDSDETDAGAAREPESAVDERGDEVDTALLDELILDLEGPRPGAEAAAQDGDFELDLELELDSALSASSATTSTDAFSLDDLLPDEEQGLEALSPAADADATAPDSAVQEFELDLPSLEKVVGSDGLPPAEPAASADRQADSAEADGLSEELDNLDIELMNLEDFSVLEDAPAAAESGPAPTEQSEPEETGAQEPALDDLNFELERDLDTSLNLLEDTDELNAKLELAQAYLDMKDKDGAKGILAEVLEEAKGEQRQRAQQLLEQMTAEVSE